MLNIGLKNIKSTSDKELVLENNHIPDWSCIVCNGRTICPAGVNMVGAPWPGFEFAGMNSASCPSTVIVWLFCYYE